MAAAGENVSALAGLERARHFAALHSELFRAQLKDDPSATVEGCFPPDDGSLMISMPEARAWEFLQVLARLHDEVNTAEELRDPLRIFRLRDRPFYDSLGGLSEEQQFQQIRGFADYLIMPKALIAAVEVHAMVEACKREYVKALEGYDLATATESRPRLLLFMCLHPCLRDLANSGINKLREEAGDSINRDSLQAIIGSFVTHKLKHGDKGHERRALLDGLMGEPIQEFIYRPSAIRVQVYAAMCVVMERPLPWDLLPTPLPVEEWLVREPWVLNAWVPNARPDRTDPLNVALALNRMGALDDMVAHGMDVSEPWSMLVRRAVEFGNPDLLERIRSLAPTAFDVSTSSHALAALETATRSARLGRKAACRWIVETLKLEEHFPSSSRLMECAACIGDLEMVKRLHAVGIALPREMLTYACRNSDMAMTEWALDRGAAWEEWPFDGSLKPENREFLLWALDHGCPLPDEDVYLDENVYFGLVCVCQGDPAFMEMLKARGMTLDLLSIDTIAAHAASMGCLELLEWAAGQAGELMYSFRHHFEWVLFSALARDQLACVDWMLRRLEEEMLEFQNEAPDLGEFSPEDACYWPLIRDRSLLERLVAYYDLAHFYKAAVWDADLETARWLLARGVKPTGKVVADICAAGEHALPLLRFCVEEAVFDLLSEPSITKHVAAGGSVAMMEYVRSKGCEWGDDAVYRAAAEGELPMLRWLRSKQVNSPWPDGLVEHARRWDEDETAAWAEEHGAPS